MDYDLNLQQHYPSDPLSIHRIENEIGGTKTMMIGEYDLNLQQQQQNI